MFKCWLLIIILFFASGCEKKQAPPPALNPSKNAYVPLPGGLGLPMGNNVEILVPNGLPPGLKIIVDELCQNRVNFQATEKKLEKWRYNESFEVIAYAEMRKDGRLKNDPACSRTVNRRYFLRELIARGSSIKNGLSEKDRTLLGFYDEAQIRDLTPEVIVGRIKELNNKLSLVAQADFNRIDQIINFLENEKDIIPAKDWAIKDNDEFMGFVGQ